MIDIIIPTMWRAHHIPDKLETYYSSNLVNKVIVIDNDPSSRPELPINQKLEIISYGRNLYVNPSWNEGVMRAKSDIVCIMNDDIAVDNDLFRKVVDFGLEKDTIIGVNLGYKDQDNYTIAMDDVPSTITKLNYDRTKPIGGQAWAFGVCMFMRRESYKFIPSLYQVWYGDDFICQRSKEIYVLRSSKITGTISETLKTFTDPTTDISRRIILDSKNLLRFSHFKNVGLWNIPHDMIRKHELELKHLKTAKNPTDVFKTEYDHAKKIKSDINENVHILYDLAKECNSVVEMGVRTGVSTRALLHAGMKLRSYDLQLDGATERLFELAKAAGRDVDYIKADVLKIDIEECDMIFIDTYHIHSQLVQELKRHASKASKYIALHDTYTFGLTGEHPQDRKGLLSAVIEFIIENPEWKFKIYKTNNNGFTVLERS